MIRRAIAVFLLTVTSMIGLASAADAGELCVRLLPAYSRARICMPTN